MARRRAATKRETLPDPKYKDIVVSKFINALMLDGKKSVAEKILYQALEIVKSKGSQDELKFFHDAVNNVKPHLEVRSRRVGGATYQVPMEVRPDRAQALSIRWLIAAAGNRGEKTMIQRLAGELDDAVNDRGSSIKKRDETHRMAESNKAFAHYRW